MNTRAIRKIKGSVWSYIKVTSNDRLFPLQLILLSPVVLRHSDPACGRRLNIMVKTCAPSSNEIPKSFHDNPQKALLQLPVVTRTEYKSSSDSLTILCKLW